MLPLQLAAFVVGGGRQQNDMLRRVLVQAKVETSTLAFRRWTRRVTRAADVAVVTKDTRVEPCDES